MIPALVFPFLGAVCFAEMWKGTPVITHWIVKETKAAGVPWLTCCCGRQYLSHHAYDDLATHLFLCNEHPKPEAHSTR